MKTAIASGSVASFWSPKPAAIKSLKVYFEPKQAGEGDPSPDNVRPIEGWTGVEVTHCMAGDTSEPQTYTISWDSIGTIYGGYVDLISGEVWKTHHYYAFTGDEQFLTLSSSWTVVYLPRINGVNPTANRPSSGVCSHYLYNPFAKNRIGVMYNKSDCTFDGTIRDAEGWKAFAKEQYDAGTPIEVAYRLRDSILLGTLTPQQLSSFIGRNNLFSNASRVEVEYEYADSPELEVIKKRIALNEPHINNASGSIANFYTDMASPMKSLKVNFEAKQSGTGDPSPDNVRPITGVDQINVYRTGKNLCHIVGYSAKTHTTLLANRATQNDYGTSISTINYTSPDTPLVVTQSSHDESIYPNHYNNGFFVVMLDSLSFSKTYNVSFRVTDILSNPLNVTLSNINIGRPDGSETSPTTVEGDRLIYKNISFNKNRTHDAQYFFIRCCGMSYTMSEFMVTEATEEDQTYEPYTGSIIPCSFSELGTQYGGYVDLVKGTLTKTWIGITRKLSEAYKVVDYDTTLLYDHRFMFDSYVVNNWQTQKCSIAPYSWNLENGKTHFYVYSGTISADCNSRAMIYMPPETDPETEFTLALQLQDPITYQLTPQQIKTFRGTNNIYSFDGTVDVKYWLHSDVKTERKTVVWNNKCNGYISDADWKDRNTDETHTTFEDGVATVDFYNSPGSYHTMVQKVSPPIVLNNKYYYSYFINPNETLEVCGAEFAGGAQVSDNQTYLKNTWTQVSNISYGRRDGTGAMYIPFIWGGRMPENLIAQVKSPVYVDLTLMFGAGNEPATVEEFEHLCAINGVDLTKPQVYDEGTERSWIIN